MLPLVGFRVILEQLFVVVAISVLFNEVAVYGWQTFTVAPLVANIVVWLFLNGSGLQPQSSSPYSARIVQEDRLPHLRIRHFWLFRNQLEYYGLSLQKNASRWI